jgi:3-oxoadipate enol-lactonase
MPYAPVNDVNLYYEVHGEGEPFVFIAGTGSSCEYMKVATVPWLSREFQLIIYDARGTGRSDKPDHPYSTRMFARDTVGLLEHLGISRAHVGGRSMGGRVAQWVALDAPYRVGALVLSNSGPGSWVNANGEVFEPTRGLPYETGLKLAQLGYEGYLKQHRESDFMFTPEFAEANPDLVRQFSERSGEPTPLPNYIRHVIARQQHETRELLPKILAPTLVIDGVDDTVSLATGNHVESSRQLARGIPGAELVLYPGAHNFLIEQPESHQIIIDFVKRHPLSS